MNRKRYKFIIIFSVTALAVTILLSASIFINYPLKYEDSVYYYCSRYDVDPYLVFAVIKTESRFKEQAVSIKGATGLMQLMPSTAKWIALNLGIEYSDEKLMQADYNINLGVWYLSYLFRKFQNIDHTIISYNAGEGNTYNWIKNGKINEIPFKETAEYLQKVHRAQRMYKKLYNIQYGV